MSENKNIQNILAAMFLISTLSPDGGYGGIDICITCKNKGLDKCKDTETGQELDLCETCPNNITNAYKPMNNGE